MTKKKKNTSATAEANWKFEGPPTEGPWCPERKTVRGVDVYCSDACGGGTSCPHSDYVRAKEKAVAMAEKLSKHFSTETWTVCVHENLGWHWRVTNDIFTVSGMAWNCQKDLISVQYKSTRIYLSGKHPVQLINKAAEMVRTEVIESNRRIEQEFNRMMGV